jgi:Domain of unknown function (DUF4440)
MYSMLAIAVALLSLFAAPAGRGPQPNASTAREVEQVENGRLASMEKGDIDAVAKVIADDFIVIGADGRTSGRSEYLDRLRSATSPRPHLIHDEVTIRGVRRRGRDHGPIAISAQRSGTARAGSIHPRLHAPERIVADGRGAGDANHTGTLRGSP